MTFYADRFGGVTNEGEFEVTGAEFKKHVAYQVTPFKDGVPAQDGATGIGYIMYSAESVHTRFSANAPYYANNDHLIAVKYFSGQWHYDDNFNYHSFTPVSADVLLASLDFTNDTVTSLEGTDATENGIAKGYVTGDLVFFADRFAGVVNDGEFEVEGTHFVRNEKVSVGTLNYGIAAQDGATGTGYIMYSADNVHTRFSANPPYYLNSDHLIAVKYFTDKWHYDDNDNYREFTPVSTDVLLAEADFSNDTVTPLEGGGTENPYAFTGRRFDGETELFYFRARCYVSHIGRFIARDAAKFADGVNSYLYGRANPIQYVDPSGFQSIVCRCCGWTTAVAAYANLVTGGVDRSGRSGGNAFAHCLVACRIAKFCGMNCARTYWDAREDDPTQFTDQQDLQNNQVGYGGRHAGTNCWDYCGDQWKHLKLTCSIIDPKTNWPIGLKVCPPPDSFRDWDVISGVDA